MENGQASQSNQSLTARTGLPAGIGKDHHLSTPAGGSQRRPGGGSLGGSPPTTINNNNIVININKNYNAATAANMRKQLKQVREEIFDDEGNDLRNPAVEEEEDEGNEDDVDGKSGT